MTTKEKIIAEARQMGITSRNEVKPLQDKYRTFMSGGDVVNILADAGIFQQRKVWDEWKDEMLLREYNRNAKKFAGIFGVRSTDVIKRVYVLRHRNGGSGSDCRPAKTKNNF